MKKSLRILSVLLTSILVVTMVTPMTLAVDFSDTRNHWAKSYIEAGVKAGYISGYPDGKFRPNNSLTRGAFCKILNKALKLQATASISFADVKSSDVFYTEIRKAVYAGYISGYSDQTFRANASITRQEAAVMLSRILPQSETKKNLNVLKDAGSIADFAKSGAQTVLSKGYITGDENGRFNPKKILTRAQAAKIISVMLKGEHVVHGAVNYTTSNKTYSNNIYVGPLESNISGSGKLTFDNCKLLGMLTVKNSGAVNLKDSTVTALSVQSSSGAHVNASGATEIKNTYVADGANLTESNLSGNGFQTVLLNGTGLKGKTVALRGGFPVVSVSSPANVNLSAGSISALSVKSSAAGSKFDLASGTNVASATIDGICSFTGNGKIASAVQNVAGVTYQTTPGRLTGAYGNSLTPTVTPSNGSNNVSTSTSITLKFEDSLYNSSGKQLTASHITNNVLELRSGYTNGSRLSYNASINKDRTQITITPTSTLQGNTTYYVILLEGGLKNSSGVSVNRQTFSFSTAKGTLVPKVDPSDDTSVVPVTVRPTLTFNEEIYAATYSGWQSASNVLSKAFHLYKNSVSSGNLVSMTPSLSGRVVTLTPTYSLSANTTYVIELESNYLKNSTGAENTYQTFSFTTNRRGDLVPTVNPSNGTTNVSVGVRPTLTFSEEIYSSKYSGWTSASYALSNAFHLYKNSVSSRNTVSMTPSISGRTVTLTPYSSLSPNTTYVIELDSNYLKNSAGTVNTYQTFTFSTGANGDLIPSVSPSNGTTNVSVSVRPTLTFNDEIYAATYSGWTSASYVLSSAFRLYKNSVYSGNVVSMTPSLSGRTVTLTPSSSLSPNTTYVMELNSGYLKNSSGTVNGYQTFSFTTNSSGNLVPTVSPGSGATNVSLSVRPTLTFGEEIYAATYSGWTSASYVLSSAFRLYKNSVSSGNTVSMTPSLSGRTVTLAPSSDLAPNTTYVIELNSGYLKNGSGTVNGYQTFSFRTINGGYPTVSISSGTSDVSPNSAITLQFSEAIYQPNGSSVSTSYASSYLKIYNSSGTQVPYTVTSVGSSSITLLPNSALDGSSQYQVSVPSSVFRNSAGLYTQATNLSLRTKAIDGVKITSVSTTVNSISITFQSSVAGTATVYCNNSNQPFTVSANGSYTATFSNLTPNTSYRADVVVVPSGQSVSYSAYQNATTKAPTVTISIGSNNQTATVTSDYPGSLSLACSGATVTPATATLARAGSIPVSIEGLSPGNSYTLTATLEYTGGTATANQSFSVAALSTDTTLTSFWFQVSGSAPTYISNPSADYTYESTVAVAEGTPISFGAVACAGATVSLNTTQYQPVSSDGSITVNVTVTSAAGNSTVYSIKIPLSVTAQQPVTI